MTGPGRTRSGDRRAPPAADTDAAFAPARRRLHRRLTVGIAAWSAGIVALFGAIEMSTSWQQSRARLEAAQLGEARHMVLVLELTIRSVVQQLEAVERLPWTVDDWLSVQTRRDEYGRLLKLMPYVESIQHRDASGERVLTVSRLQADAVPVPGGAAPDAATVAPPQSRVRFRNGNDPVLDLVLQPDAQAATAGRTIVTIGLRSLARELAATLERSDAEVYVVDVEGAVVLHRNPSVLLSRNIVAVPQEPSTWFADRGLNRDDAKVVMSVVPIPGLPWRVVIEQPQALLMAPMWTSLQRTGLFILLAVLASSLAATLVARRFTRPIRQLHTGAQQLARGELDTRIDLRTGDELQDLAAQFNRMAESLQSSIEELERRVDERTQALHRANEAKSEFLAHMSHELRTPLNSILGFADVLREGMAGPLSDDQREYVGDIHASGLHLLALVNDVLDIARIEARRLDLELGPVAVHDVVTGAAGSLRAACRAKGLELAVHTAGAPPEIVADARRLRQVLLNLLGNAVKFTTSGAVAVRVLPGQGLPGGLRIEVQDTGPGIPPEALATIWEPFVRVGRDGRIEGAGLGLPLVKQLVELHGGEVGVASTPGVGSTFHFELPAVPPGSQGEHR